MEKIDWKSVKSSNIEEVAWKKGTGEIGGILFVRFIRSGIYSYLDVPETVFKEMVEAHSVGRFFAENIKGKFEYVKDAPVSD